jgi:hypothetical protein
MKGKPQHTGPYKGNADVWVFLNAIVSTRVYANGAKNDEKETEALTTFWTFLCPSMEKPDVTDREAMQKWVSELHKSYCMKELV